LPDKDFLGTRSKTQEGKPYEWKTFKQIFEISDILAKGFQALNFSPLAEHDG